MATRTDSKPWIVNLHRLQSFLFAATLKNDKLRGFKMVATYHAMLRAGRLDWGTEGPPTSLSQLTVPVTLTVETTPPTPSTRGQAMASALAKIAESGGAQNYGDPMVWQLETRQDRPLPGRSE
ncbi:MAG: hypothetical protein QM703_15440 [Gemmatales bacterium]